MPKGSELSGVPDYTLPGDLRLSRRVAWRVTASRVGLACELVLGCARVSGRVGSVAAPTSGVVVPAVAEDRVIVFVARQVIVSRVTTDDVLLQVAVNVAIVRVAGVDVVGILAAVDLIIATVAEDVVVARTAVEMVAALIPVEEVVGLVPAEVVLSFEPEDDVRPSPREDHVRAGRAAEDFDIATALVRPELGHVLLLARLGRQVRPAAGTPSQEPIATTARSRVILLMA